MHAVVYDKFPFQYELKVVLGVVVGGGSAGLVSVLANLTLPLVMVDDWVGEVGEEVWEVVLDAVVGQDTDIMLMAGWRMEGEQELWMHVLAVE